MECLNRKIDFNRLKGTINESAAIGEIPENGLRRLALSDEDKKMRDLFKRWMKDAGLQVRVDDFGNMYGRRRGKNNQSPVVMGSHLDSQPNGGRFDGVLGVLSALEVIRTLNDYGIETERPIELVNFTNEEGARFEPPMMASGALAGKFSRSYVYNRNDTNGRRFGDELKRIDYQGTEENRLQNIHSFIELHIEQGPILEKEEVSIGAVEGIQGMKWLELTVTGESDHAGSTPMDLRRDALTAASQMINTVEEEAKRSGVTATVGRLSLYPDVVNGIPGEVVFSLDIRHFDDEWRDKIVQEIKREIESVALNRDVTVDIKELWNGKTVVFSPELVQLIKQAAQEYGFNVKNITSGAGHDAKYMHEIAPTAMIFVPSVNGKSHVESELTYDEDIERGANILYKVITQLANNKTEI